MTLATSDSGSYTCASGDLTKTVKLTVLDKIAFVDSPNGAPIAKPIVLGLDNEVICQVNVLLPPQIYYYLTQGDSGKFELRVVDARWQECGRCHVEHGRL